MIDYVFDCVDYEMEMEMEKKKKLKRSKPQDRLSELPDSLIFSIFEFLPMKYVVRTQLLSHRWKNLWTLTPFLEFYDYGNSDDKDAFRNLVNRYLLSWRGTRVQKFTVSGCEFRNLLLGDLNLWVRFAVDNGVEELDISFRTTRDEGDDYILPQCLYSCSSLRKLSLEVISMDVRGNVGWNNLKSLSIYWYEVSGHVIDQILRGSPLLEVFILKIEETYKNLKLCFRSPSLKELCICKAPAVNADITFTPITDFMNTEVQIWTPNLEKLTISGMPYRKCLLMNVSSLTHVNLSFNVLRELDSANVCLGNTLSQIFLTIQHVEGLTLSDWCIEVLGVMKSKCLRSPLSKVKLLILNGSFEEHEQIVDVLEIFPKLKTLLVNEEENDLFDVKSKLKVEANPSKSFLEELKTVKVTFITKDSSIFPLIKSLLQHASKLEKMMFRVEGFMPRSYESLDYLFKASQELLRMPRSSPTAELIFDGMI